MKTLITINLPNLKILKISSSKIGANGVKQKIKLNTKLLKILYLSKYIYY